MYLYVLSFCSYDLCNQKSAQSTESPLTFIVRLIRLIYRGQGNMVLAVRQFMILAQAAMKYG